MAGIIPHFFFSFSFWFFRFLLKGFRIFSIHFLSYIRRRCVTLPVNDIRSMDHINFFEFFKIVLQEHDRENSNLSTNQFNSIKYEFLIP